MDLETYQFPHWNLQPKPSQIMNYYCCRVRNCISRLILDWFELNVLIILNLLTIDTSMTCKSAKQKSNVIKCIFNFSSQKDNLKNEDFSELILYIVNVRHWRYTFFLHETTKYMMMQFISLCHTRPTIEIMVIFWALNFLDGFVCHSGIHCGLYNNSQRNLIIKEGQRLA